MSECQQGKSTTMRMTLEQREVMLHFMKAHSNFARGKISDLGPEGAKVKAKLIQQMAEELNSLSNGATKTGEKWMKSWQDWRSDVKAKAAKIKKSVCGTGGGPATKLTLTPLEEDLLAFLGPVVVEGLRVSDPLVIQDEVNAKASEEMQEEEAAMLWDQVDGDLHLSIDVDIAPDTLCTIPAVPRAAVSRAASTTSLLTFATPRSPAMSTSSCASTSISNLSVASSIPSAPPSPSPSQLTDGKKKRKHTRSESSVPSSSNCPEPSADKVIELSEVQNSLMKSSIDLKEEMVSLKRETNAIQERALAIQERSVAIQEKQNLALENSLRIQERQAASVETAATAIAITMKIFQDVMTKWLEKH